MSEPSGPYHADKSAISTPAASIEAIVVCGDWASKVFVRPVQRNKVASQGACDNRSVVICALTSMVIAILILGAWAVRCRLARNNARGKRRGTSLRQRRAAIARSRAIRDAGDPG